MIQKWEYLIAVLDAKGIVVNYARKTGLEEHRYAPEAQPDFMGLNLLSQFLGTVGDEGWELVGIHAAHHHTEYYFKRPLE
jgi:hypothetical protein